MDRERVVSHQTVVVRGGQIIAFGPAARVAVPAGALRVDGRGKYLLPGLADMHTHPFSQHPFDHQRLIQYLAEGVTTIRDMHSGGSSAEALRIKRAVAMGTLLGPRVYTAGDPVDAGILSDMNYQFAALADSSVQARQRAGDALSRRYALADSVRVLKRAGHDFVKLYAFPHPAYDSVVAAAHQVGLRIAGHVPSETGTPGVDIPLAQVLQDHWASIEHLTGYFAALTGVSDQAAYYGTAAASPDTMAWTQPDYHWDRAAIRRLAIATRRAGVWNCPTMAVLTRVAAWSPPDATPLVRRWRRRLVEFDSLMTQALQEAGAGLLLGTDGAEHVTDELEALVMKAGLTPYQALATGTHNVAEFLNTQDSTGTVAVGKRADLVLLAGNPLQDVQAVAAPVGVMINGRWLSRTELAALQPAGHSP